MATEKYKQHRDGVQRVRDATGKVSGYRVEIRRAGYPKITKRFKRLEDARAWRRRLANEIDERQADPAALSSRYTVTAAIDAYLASDFHDRKLSTQRTQRSRLAWWKQRIGDVVLRDLSRGMVRDNLASLTCSGVTKNRYQSDLSAVLSSAQESDWITRNVALEVKRKPDAKRRERVIQGPEWRRLLKAARKHAAEPEATLLMRQLPNYLRLLYATGMRCGEALKLRWQDVDLDQGRAVLRETKNKVDRVVPLDDEAKAALRAQRDFSRDHWPWVFVGRSPLKPACRFNREFDFAKAAARIAPTDKNGEPLVMHSLRHSFATEIGDGGASLAELMAAGGWKSSAQALRYMKTTDEAPARAIAKRVRA